jgi:hypothetical protein
VTYDEICHAFDRIRAALAKQESERKKPDTFGAWVVRALPHFVKLVDAIDDAERENYGLVWCAWWDWLDARRLAYRGRITWAIPSDGPLHFTPPSMSGLLARAGEVIHELGLEDALRRSARWSSAPTQKTPGGAGRKKQRGLTVRRSK